MDALKDPVNDLYEQDFAAWALEQAEAIKRKDWSALDLPNLVEELESMGRQQRAELRNRLAVLLMNLLKWQFQPMHREFGGASWLRTIRTQRSEIESHLEDSPSLKSYIPDAMTKAYRKAVFAAAEETGFDTSAFPTDCPYTWEQAMDGNWLPK
jgi:Domain of unknown function DUF29